MPKLLLLRLLDLASNLTMQAREREGGRETHTSTHTSTYYYENCGKQLLAINSLYVKKMYLESNPIEVN
jgi:hypothetical protein